MEADRASSHQYAESGSSGELPSIAPDRCLRLQDGRPTLGTKGLWFVRLGVVVFRPIVVLWIILRQRIMVSRVHRKLQQLRQCRDRAELEQLLGAPLYAVDAEAVGKRGVADRIECYESDGCCIDVWFKDGRLVEVSGFVKPTLWDMALTRNTGPETEGDADG
ncbi:MAG: hypothetical protein A2V70_17820 [Planctomycetes bacterium RBG_13_63_9]|nr:MAG: hypothetical protein A2V70_17820 [Planctomycetes bacterium RBG_13_63_9]